MNQRTSTPGSANARKAWLFLAFAVPALATKAAHGMPSPACAEDDAIPLDSREESRPYLRFVGPPQLRFQEALPPPDLSSRPPGGAPPKIHEMPRDEIAAGPGPAPAVPRAQPAPPIPARKQDPVVENKVAPDANPGMPILPDDAGTKVRPDNFLPYFQFPGTKPGGNESTVKEPPEPQTLPPSTATYTER